MRGMRRVGFEVASYDVRRPLFIDPILTYSTYLGGSGGGIGAAVTNDSAGNAYVTGQTNSADFPITGGAFQSTYPGGSVAFVTKLNASGTALLYSTWLGGVNGANQDGNDIAIDSAGDAYVTGITTEADFPTTTGAFETTYGAGSIKGFVTKLNPTGSALIYSTFLGGTNYDAGDKIALDSAGEAYITGTTEPPISRSLRARFKRLTAAVSTTLSLRN